ncbi:MAG TPA: nuclease-related domain-containing protein [Caldisericia bacterium]|nr:nuclease-related domain-containing protein [Caldisericia bacterium]
MNTINKKNFVKEMISSLQFQTLIELLIALAGFLLMVQGIENQQTLVFLAGSVAFIFGAYLYQSKVTQTKIWRSGLTGQHRVEEALANLDDRYTLINNMSLPFKKCDMDHILIGPNGIFLIETKNYKGEITCIGDRWEYQKVGRNGGLYRGHINNPSKQLKRSIWELKNYLDKKSKKILQQSAFPYWIQGVLVFTNKEAVLRTRDETVVVVYLDQLLGFIRSYRNEVLHSKDIEQIIKLFKEL